MAWLRSEASWSNFTTRMLLGQATPRNVIGLVDSFLFGTLEHVNFDFVLRSTAIRAADPDASVSSQSGATSCFIPAVKHAELAPPNEGSPIQEVMHIEPAAEICPDEAEQITTLQHAGFIERNLGVGLVPEQSERVSLLQLNRTTSDLVKALAEGPALNQCRAQMQDGHCQFKLASGAFIFVQPSQYHSAIQAAETTLGVGGLKSSHIIFGENVEYLLEEALDSVRSGTWAKYQQQLICDSLMSGEISAVSEVDLGSKNDDVDSDNASDWSVEWIVKKTFLCLVPRPQLSDYSGALSV